MKTLSKFYFLKCGAAPVALAVTLLAGPTGALAQAAPPAAAPAATTSDNASAEIIVTGSRITNRPDLQSASPVQVVTAETLGVTNTSTVESYLTRLPQFSAGVNGATNNGSNGFATVDLRNLGPKRTLVLINGRRMVPGDINGVVDIDAIPAALIKRVDILTGGASSVYGADAISGVVNFILDDKFEGIAADVSDQVTTYGDGKQFNASLTLGTKLGDSGGHLVVAGQYTDRDGIYQSARGYSAQNLAYTPGSGFRPSGSSNTVPTVIELNSGRYQANSAGNFGPYTTPYNYNPANYLETPLGKYSLMGMLTLPVSDSVEFYMRGSYTNSKINEVVAPTATAGFPFTISRNNPYLTPSTSNLIFGDPNNVKPDGTATVGIRRRIIETIPLGGRDINFQTSVTHGIVGFRGTTSNDFKWDVFAEYGESKQHQDLLNDISLIRTTQAINAVSTANGPACADPSGGCIPINLFGTTPIPTNALNYILENGSQDNRYTQMVTGGNIGGTLGFLKSPFAEKAAAVSVGVEYRRETGSQSVSQNYGSGDMIYFGQGTAVPEASFNAKEIFGELQMPVVTDKPFFRALNIEGGIRYSAYNNYTAAGHGKFNALTFKGGGDWTPVQGLRLRAIFNRAIRDPNINELNSPLVQGNQDALATDPCSGGAPQTNAGLAAKCIAQGAPSNIVKTGIIQDVTANQAQALTGGNPALKPETADTWTFGVVISPPSIRGLHITVDYYRINLTNAITSDSAQDIFNQCFNNNDNSFCNLIKRNNFNGQLTGSIKSGVVESLVNIAGIKTNGIDMSADYKLLLAHNSSLTLAVNGTYVTKWAYQGNSASAPVACAGKFGNDCSPGAGAYGNLSGNPIPRWKHVASVTYQNGPFGLYLAWRYISPVSPDADTSAPKIPSYSWFDSTASLKVATNFTLRVGVQNMFNIDPPVVGGAAGTAGANSANTFPQTYDPLGRTVFANLNVKF